MECEQEIRKGKLKGRWEGNWERMMEGSREVSE
jgi:hypothetical protein